MPGITITDVKIVGMCSKCRKEGDEILSDKNGRVYENKELSCIGCSVGKEKTLSDKGVNDLSSNPIPTYYWQKDVQKFIEEIKQWTWKNNTIPLKGTTLSLAITDGGWVNVMKLHDMINERAGKRLVNKEEKQ